MDVWEHALARYKLSVWRHTDEKSSGRNYIHTDMTTQKRVWDPGLSQAKI